MRKFSFVTTPSRDRHRDFKVNCAPEQHQLERGSIFHPELFGRLRLLEGGDDIRRETRGSQCGNPYGDLRASTCGHDARLAQQKADALTIVKKTTEVA
jgi:hypothetical protein